MNLPARWWPFGQKSAQSLTIDGMRHSPVGGSGMFGPVSWLFGANGMLNASKIDWEKEVADPLKASVLMAPINWLMRTFPEAPLVLEERNVEQKRWEPIDDHPMLDLIDNPNPYYSGETLSMCTALDLSFGNAFILKIRNRNGRVVQLWWAPRQMMRPRYPLDGSKYIEHWEYRVGSQTFEVPVDDVMHIRFGLDPRDPRMGLSPLGSLLREVAIDEQASNFTATILKNLGIIGLIVSPKAQGTGAQKSASEESVKKLKEYLIRNFTADRRGDPLAVGTPIEAQLLQYNLEGFNVGPIRDVSEERVCAAIGIPAAVVGFGTGLQQTKVGATMKEMRQLAWIGGVIPMQRIVANEIRRSLLPEFIPNASRGTHRVRFDSGAVPLLWETPTEKHDRIRKDYDSGLIKRGEARLESGRPAPDAKDDTYKKNPTASIGGAKPNPDEKPADSGEEVEDV